MTLFDVLSMIGGLCLFLFGMHVMCESLERRAGDGLKSLLARLTNSKIKGFLTGLGITAVIQSSSATTVMVVVFVNSGIMTLRQSIGVIMGANIGTTVTSWILSLGGISGDNLVLQLLKPMSFTPVLALIGTIFIMFSRSDKRKDTGTILLGFAVLMFGMDAMSSAVSGLADVRQFRDMFVMFHNPFLAVIVGAVLTAVIQSSSASVGILQALTVTGKVTFGAAIPIIMGQNIGTCINALISSLGTNKNAKRAAIVHLAFNVVGTIVWLSAFSVISYILKPAILSNAATHFGIAVCHTLFNVLCTALLLPMSSLLEKIACKIVPDNDRKDEVVELDERLLATPSIALERCHVLVNNMANESISAFKASIGSLGDYDTFIAQHIREAERSTDHYEDIIGTYLSKLSRHQVSNRDSATVSKLFKAIGDFERISDHGVNMIESAEEMNSKGIEFSEEAKRELDVLCSAVSEILTLATDAFVNNDLEAARRVEPLEQVVDDLKTVLRDNHIDRLRAGSSTVEIGFVWSDILTNLERTADHCLNIAACVIDAEKENMNVHESLATLTENNPDFNSQYDFYSNKYNVVRVLNSC